MLEELKKYADKLKEKQATVLSASQDLEAHNKAFMAWLSASLGLPENSQMHIAELLLKTLEKLK